MNCQLRRAPQIITNRRYISWANLYTPTNRMFRIPHREHKEALKEVLNSPVGSLRGDKETRLLKDTCRKAECVSCAGIRLEEHKLQELINQLEGADVAKAVTWEVGSRLVKACTECNHYEAADSVFKLLVKYLDLIGKRDIDRKIPYMDGAAASRLFVAAVHAIVLAKRTKIVAPYTGIAALNGLADAISNDEMSLGLDELVSLKVAWRLVENWYDEQELATHVNASLQSVMDSVCKPCMETDTEVTQSSAASDSAESANDISFKSVVSAFLHSLEVEHDNYRIFIGPFAFSMKNMAKKVLYVCEMNTDYFHNKPEIRRPYTIWKYQTAVNSGWKVVLLIHERKFRELHAIDNKKLLQDEIKNNIENYWTPTDAGL